MESIKKYREHQEKMKMMNKAHEEEKKKLQEQLEYKEKQTNGLKNQVRKLKQFALEVELYRGNSWYETTVKDEAFQQSVDEGRMLEGKLKEEIFRKELENRKKLEETRVEKVKNEAFKEGFEKGFTEEKVKYDKWAKKREDWYAEQG